MKDIQTKYGFGKVGILGNDTKIMKWRKIWINLLNIYFDHTHGLMCPLIWEIDKTNQFIQLDYGEGLARMNICFNTEDGNYIFKIEQSNCSKGSEDGSY